MQNLWAGKDLVTIDTVTAEHIEQLFARASQIESGKFKLDGCAKHKIIANCFYEPSTRTRMSFAAAAYKIGANVIGFSDIKATSSGSKRESLMDSMRVISGYADALVIRHPNPGSAKLAAQFSQVPVINAGDGSNQHPSQTLLDLYSIYKSQNNKTDNLNILIMGDLKYGRTVHSLVQALSFYNPRIYFVSPKSLVLPISLLHWLRDNGVRFSLHDSKEEVLPLIDVAYLTRLQKERFNLSVDDELTMAQVGYDNQYKLTLDDLSQVKDNFRILHPLPRQQELDVAIDDTKFAYYFEQAKLGVIVRSALLSLILEDS